jgi:hypothetical protein
MQLRIKAMYGKIMSRLITLFWVLEVLAVLALGVASLAAINGSSIRIDTGFVTDIFTSDSVHDRRYSDVQSDIFTSVCVFILGADSRL